MAVALDMLRRRIRALEGRPPAARQAVSSGWAPLDAVGGLPRPGVMAVAGPLGAGGTAVLLTVAAVVTGRGERVVWVEPSDDDAWPLHPPSAQAWGVELSRLLLVRARGAQAAWAAEQAVASGACGLVVLSGGLSAGVAPRLVRAAWRGHGTLAVQGERLPSDLRAEVTVQVRGGRARVQARRGRVPQAVGVPAGPEAAQPWR